MAFVPLHQFHDALGFIRGQSPDDDQCRHYLEYFVRTYTQEYPIELWNQHGRSQQPRTNNHVEGYNRKLKTLHQNDSNIYTWIEKSQLPEADATCQFISRTKHNGPNIAKHRLQDINRENEFHHLFFALEQKEIDLFTLMRRVSFKYSYDSTLDRLINEINKSNTIGDTSNKDDDEDGDNDNKDDDDGDKGDDSDNNDNKDDDDGNNDNKDDDDGDNDNKDVDDGDKGDDSDDFDLISRRGYKSLVENIKQRREHITTRINTFRQYGPIERYQYDSDIHKKTRSFFSFCSRR